MTEVEKEKGIGKPKIGLVVSGVLIVILAISSLWLYTEVNSLQSQVSTLETDNSSLQSQVSSLLTDKNNLQSQVSSLETWLDGNKTLLQTTINERNQLQTWLDSNVTDYESQIQNLNSQITTLNSQINSLNAQITSLQSQVSSLETWLDGNKTLLQTTINERNQLQTWLDGNITNYESQIATLNSQIDSLNDQMTSLQTDYETLENAYNILLEQHETLLELWNEPLEYVVTPTWDEVIAWLEIDQTNETSYDPEKFLCGDFSIMLIQHAKAMHWRMLLTVLEFDYYEENPTGIEDHHGYHAHAFVSIFTAEGIVYIEPQSDFTWYLYETGDPETHVEFSDWEFIDFGEDWFGHIFVQYYNRMEANVEPIENSSVSIEVGVPTNS